MAVVRLNILIGGTPVPPTGAHLVVLPNPVTLVPGVPTTVTVKMDDGTGTLTDLLPTQFLVPFWSTPTTLGIVETHAGNTLTLTAPVTAPPGSTTYLDIDVRG